METAAERIKAKARQLGFTSVGMARAEPLAAEADHLGQWLGRGYHGTMHWMARDDGKRTDPAMIVPGARSIIALALNYYTSIKHSADPETGKISRYAWGDDYHDILLEKLEQLWTWIRSNFPAAQGKYYVDTGPVMEKAWAQRAGIGWIGKHTNVITRVSGSWVFLSEIITTLELDPDPPAADHCGTCTLCIDACPTGAIVGPYVLDSTRCISYLTIEHRGRIDDPIAEHFDRWIYGCDVCQDVCPWNNKFSVVTEEHRFQPRAWNVAPRLQDWVSMDETGFSEQFRGSPVRRTKFEGLMRNIFIVLRHARSSTSASRSQSPDGASNRQEQQSGGARDGRRR